MADDETNPSGNILNFFCEMPHHLSTTEIETAFDELDAELIGMREPPVASLSGAFESWAEIEDYRRFYVQFEPEATAADAHQAVDIVISALARLSGEQPSV